MRKIIKYLREYQAIHLDVKLYLTIALFLLVCFIFNYSLDFEDSHIDDLRGSIWYTPAMFSWMLFPFLTIVLIMRAFDKPVQLDTHFWIMALVGFAVIGIDRTFLGYKTLFRTLPYEERFFFSQSAYWASSIFTNVLPIVLISLFLDKREKPGCYGLMPQKTDFKPYLTLLALAFLGIAIASFIGDLKAYYPRYAYSGGDRFTEKHDSPAWMAVMIYEMCYGSDFVGVELFFRGFLIFAFGRSLGGYAVLAMVGSYAFLHFGKPLTEAISSIFGGYLMGILSYKTRSIWGGIVVHLGVAWSMEFFGYLQRLL